MKSKFLAIVMTACMIISSMAAVGTAEEIAVNEIQVKYVRNDATEVIQAALTEARNTPGRDRIILKNPGKNKTWVSGPLYIFSNTELYLEDGAVLKAKEGSIPYHMESFINIVEVQNVSVVGANRETCIIEMPIEEYKDSEHRHSILIAGSKNVIIRGLNLYKSGGDGICVTDLDMLNDVPTVTPENIIIDNVTIDGAARNGISFIAGNNIIVNNIVSKNTGQYNPAGLAAYGPWAGIDWEPESRSYMNNTKIYNSQFLNNKSTSLVLGPLKPNKVDDTLVTEIKNCVTGGSPVSVSVMGNSEVPVSRTILENCYFQSAPRNIAMQEWRSEEFLLKDCVFIEANGGAEGLFTVTGNGELENYAAEFELGNMKFDNVRMYGSTGENLIKLTGGNDKFKIKNVTGTVYSDRGDEKIVYDAEFCENIDVKIEKAEDTQEEALAQLEERGKAYIEEGAKLVAEMEAKMKEDYAATYNYVDPIAVKIGWKRLSFPEQEPVIIDGRTLVPMRTIFEELGATVEWVGETRTVIATKDDIKITLSIDNKTAQVNGEDRQLDVAPMLINNKTMIPLRFVGEALGASVNWHPVQRYIIIKKAS